MVFDYTDEHRLDPSAEPRAMSALLDEVLDAHGGLTRWRNAATIHARVRTGGLLLRTRVPGNRLADYRITVTVARQRVVLDPFPRAGQRGVFERPQVRIESDDGQVLSSRTNARAAFFGRPGLRRNIRWDPLDSVYFAGYAMWNYLTTPYLLTREGVEVSEVQPWQQGGQTWRRLRVSFPATIDTHSPRQTYYFDGDGQLRRHDYVPEVIGHWARAAHYCAEPIEADGLVFPTRRWVHPIGPGNRSLPFPTLVSIQLADVHVDTE
ncbi:hypothetical protein NJB1907f44_21030 [Mycobacterium marinum]|uniref:Uncharacterized protein n=2 Tax=Mycobacterium TaxID=1763 RepID=A0A7I7LGK5_9MYCO|nr:hypothetical protein MSHO_38640 [Mycobacterium shottsii]GJO01830.1 hypothetical protein NJB1808e29_24860 [Mycobacterium marinum]GJO13338.1 hypothetical protein NJB1907f34b_49100 [Mycobacterium marinum]GJO19142.1 hypothetical protein NJB1907E90_49240 [Mycobacterium marinum]GJO19873.1 hypothetical protein NJB1907E11_26420 [Mycobacterium marinum]